MGTPEVVAALRLALPPGADEEPAFLQEIAAFLIAKRIPSGVTVTLGVPRADFFLRRFETPPVKARNLAELVGFEIERHLPGKHEEFLCGWKVEGRLAGGGQSVLLGAARRPGVERALALLRRASFEPASVQPEAFAVVAALLRASPGLRDAILLDVGATAVGVDLVLGGRLESSRVFPVDDPQWREAAGAPAVGAAAPDDPPGASRQAAAQRLGEALGERLGAPLFREWLGGRELPEVRVTGRGAGNARLVEALRAKLGVTVRTFSPWPLVRWAAPPGDLPAYAPALALALAGPRGARTGVELAPGRQEQLHRAPSMRLTAVLAVLLALVLAAMAGGYLVRRQREVALVDGEIHRLKLRMTEVETVNRALQDRRSRLSYLDGTILRRARQADILREITRLIPDGSYLSEYSYRERVLEITGLSPAASQLLPALEASPLFTGVEFSAPIVAQGAGLERFKIRMKLEASGG